MPIVRIDWYAGRTPAQKRELAVAITEDVARIGKCPASEVEVIFNDVDRQDWSTGGTIESAE